MMQILQNWMTLFTDSTSYVFVPTTEFRRITEPGLTRGRRTMETRNKVGLFYIKAAIQRTNDINNPGTGYTEIGSEVSSIAYSPPTTNDTIDLEGYNYVRGGYIIKVTSGNGAIAVSSKIDLW